MASKETRKRCAEHFLLSIIQGHIAFNTCDIKNVIVNATIKNDGNTYGNICELIVDLSCCLRELFSGEAFRDFNAELIYNQTFDQKINFNKLFLNKIWDTEKCYVIAGDMFYVFQDFIKEYEQLTHYFSIFPIVNGQDFMMLKIKPKDNELLNIDEILSKLNTMALPTNQMPYCIKQNIYKNILNGARFLTNIDIS